MNVVGFDFGFGECKVKMGEKILRFPSFIAKRVKTYDEEVENVVSYLGEEYVLGEEAIYEPAFVEIADIKDLVSYLPIFLLFIKRKLNLKGGEKLVFGLPPKYKNYKEKVEKIIQDENLTPLVVPQGLGIFYDVLNVYPDLNEAKDVLILDIGFNTLDYLLLVKKGDVWKKRKSNTFDNLGVKKAVLIFRELLENEFLKNMPFQKLNEVFKKGYIKIEGYKIDLEKEKKRAISSYLEIIKTKLKNEVGDFIKLIDKVVVAGGGAYLIDKNEIRSDLIVPPEPELSQVRGYEILGKSIGG